MPGKPDRKRILVIDDENDLCELLSIRLSHLGYSVESALDGPSGLTMVKDFGPDVIFLDINLPGMGGWEVCQKIRAQEKGKAASIFILTGAKMDQHQKLAKEFGANGVLEKTVGFTELMEALERIKVGVSTVSMR